MSLAMMIFAYILARFSSSAKGFSDVDSYPSHPVAYSSLAMFRLAESIVSGPCCNTISTKSSFRYFHCKALQARPVEMRRTIHIVCRTTNVEKTPTS